MGAPSRAGLRPVRQTGPCRRAARRASALVAHDSIHNARWGLSIRIQGYWPRFSAVRSLWLWGPGPGSVGLSALPMAPAYWVGLRSVNMKLCVLGHADFPLGFRAHGFDTVVWSVCVCVCRGLGVGVAGRARAGGRRAVLSMRTWVVMLPMFVSGIWTWVACEGRSVVSGAGCWSLEGDWRAGWGASTAVKGVRRGVGGVFRPGAVSWPREGGKRRLEGLRGNDRTIQEGIRGFEG